LIQKRHKLLGSNYLDHLLQLYALLLSSLDLSCLQTFWSFHPLLWISQHFNQLNLQSFCSCLLISCQNMQADSIKQFDHCWVIPFQFVWSFPWCWECYLYNSSRRLGSVLFLLLEFSSGKLSKRCRLVYCRLKQLLLSFLLIPLLKELELVFQCIQRFWIWWIWWYRQFRPKTRPLEFQFETQLLHHWPFSIHLNLLPLY